MTNRRDLLKIAAGLGLTGVVPTMAERIAAIQMLDQPVSDHPALDPVLFTREAYGAAAENLGNDWDSALDPEAHAAYVQARKAVLRAEPQIKAAGFHHPWSKFEDASMNLMMAGYHSGLRHGAAFENLRRTVIGDLSQCRTCWGVGITEIGQACRSCGGNGVVATGMQSGAMGGG